MEKTNKKIIAVALALSLITAVLIYVFISDKQNISAPQIEYATVYVAAKTIPARAEITNADVRQAKTAKELLHSGAVTDIGEIVGKRTLESIIAGEQIIRDRLADEKSMTLSYSVPEGTRAVSINVNDQINVAQLVRPGDYVDIIASFEKEEEENGQVTKYYPRMTKTVLQNVKILALGQDMVLTSEKLKEPPTTVTLAVKAEDIERFIFASEYATLRLVLRPLDDDLQNASPGIIRPDVTGSKGSYTKQSENRSSAG